MGPSIGIGLSGRARDSDFALTLVSAGLRALIRPDVGQVTTSGVGLTQVNDLSGSGNTATQPGTSGARPTLTTRNGRPAMSFDGGDRLQIAGPILSGNDNWSMVASYEATSIASARCVFALALTGGAAYVLNDDGLVTRDIRIQGVGDASDGAATTAPETVIVSREAGQLKMYLNSGAASLDAPSLAMGTPTGGSAVGALNSGGTFPFIGFIWAAWAYQGGASGFLTPAQRAAVFADSLARYGF